MKNKENPDNIVYVIFRESLIQSIIADLITFGMLAFCIWFSSGSKFWSFICFLMLLIFMTTRAVNRHKTATKFRTRSKLKEWAKSL